MVTDKMTVTAQVKKGAAVVGGRRSTMVVHIPELMVSPIHTANPEVRQRMGIDTPMVLLETFALGEYDLGPGQSLVVGDNTYPIRAVWFWPHPQGGNFYQLILEDLKP